MDRDKDLFERRIDELGSELAKARRGETELRAELGEKQKEVKDLKQQLLATQELLIQKENELARITRTPGWRLLNRYGPIKVRFVLPVYELIRRVFKLVSPGNADFKPSYETWAGRCEEFRYDPDRAAREIQELSYKPLISIVISTCNPSQEDLRKTLDAVLSQFYSDWELCICDDASTARHVREIIREYSAREGRIKITFCEASVGRARALNLALKLATGEFVCLLSQNDRLTPDALLDVAVTLQEADADLIYCDEDELDSKGHRCNPFYKPAWSPDLLLSFMYIGSLAIYRKTLIDEIGGFREGFDGSEYYDLVLRFTEKTEKIAHIPRILYHKKSSGQEADPGNSVSAEKALASALSRRKIAGRIENGLAPGLYRVRRTIFKRAKVTVIIPTRDRLDLLARCVDSVSSKTDYTNYEILIVDNASRDPATAKYLSNTAHRVIRHDGPFNYSLLNNLAARHADGDYLLLLNNDTEVIAREWLSAMVEQAGREEVGAVGAKLLYPDKRIQHAGVILGVDGLAGHAHRFVDGINGAGYFNFPNVIMNYSAVTAACLMIRRELYESVGGLDEEDLAVNYNDIDLCLRLRRLGYLIVYTPYALLYHYESATRSLAVEHKEPACLASKWMRELMSDRYYNPSLSLSKADFSVDTTKLESLYLISSYESSDMIIARIAEGGSAGQEFSAGQDHLCAIGVRLGLSPRQSRGVIRLHLRRSHLSGDDLAFAELDAAQARNKEWHLFSFGPVRRSGGERFYFFIEFIDTSPGAVLNVWGGSATSMAAGNHFKNHQESQGTISFKAYCLKQVRGHDSVSVLHA